MPAASSIPAPSVDRDRQVAVYDPFIQGLAAMVLSVAAKGNEPGLAVRVVSSPDLAKLDQIIALLKPPVPPTKPTLTTLHRGIA